MAYLMEFFTCLLILIIFEIHISVSTSFIEEPEDLIVNAGDTAVLSCEVESTRRSDNVYIYWYKSTSQTTDSGAAISLKRDFFFFLYLDRFSITGTGYRFDLTIRNTRVSDSAYYYCGIFDSNLRQHIYSRVSRLDIYNHDLVPSCEIEPSSRSLEVGDRITINCYPSPTQPDDVTRQYPAMWKGTDGVRIPSVGRTNSGLLNYVFTLRDEDMNKPYTCTSSPRFPNIHNCSVTPLARPTITLTPRRATTSLGGTVIFSCVTTGIPSYDQFKWVIGFGRKGVLKLSESSGRYIVSANGESGILTITDVELTDNNTAVRCQATNMLSERVGEQSSIFIVPPEHPLSPEEPLPPGVSSTPVIQNGGRLPVLQTASPSLTAKDKQHNPTQIDDSSDDSSLGKNNPAVGVSSKGGSTMERPQNGAGGTIIAILISLFVLLVLIAVVVLLVRKRQGKPTPRILKRLSVNRPLPLRNFSFSKPKFVQRVSLSKGIQNAQDKIEVVHRRISTLKSTTTSTVGDKRASTIRDSRIEVLVNPPPPDWQFRNVEDVDKLQRQRMIQRHAPSGAYSHKEMDLINSLITGSVKMKTLDGTSQENQTIYDETVEIDDDDGDSQFESDFEENEFDEPMSDSGNRAIDPSPRAPPRKKRVKKQKKVNPAGNNTYEDTVAMETKNTGTVAMKSKNTSHVEEQIYANSEIAMAVAAASADMSYTPVECHVNDVISVSPTYAIVNRNSKLSSKS